MACVFLTGLAFARYQEVMLLMIPAGLLLQEWTAGVRFRNWKLCAGRSIFLLSACCLGMLHMSQEQTFRNAYLSKLEEGDKVTIWGEIKSFETAEYGNRCILTDCYIRIYEDDGTTSDMPCNEVMVYTSSDHFQVGEIHEITGQFQRFSTARNQGNFDSERFYQSRKIDFIVEEESSHLLGNNLNGLERMILSFKENVKQVYETCMKEQTAGFYVAMILGDQSQLEESTRELFAMGGISHVLAISGLHMSIIGRRLYQMLRKLRVSFLTAGFLAGNVLLIYCWMVGSGMSAIRAVGMMLLFFLAQYMGRSYDMLNALGGMCIVLLWENAFLLEYSGFWFSVLALLGVGFVGNVFSEQVKIGKSFWMSVGITLATLPLTAYCYYEIPLYSPLVNMAALPILAPVFLLAVAGGLTGLWLPGVAEVLLIPCGWLFGFYEWICRFTGSLPGAVLITGKPQKVTVVVYYLVLCVGILLIKHYNKDKICERHDADTDRHHVFTYILQRDRYKRYRIVADNQSMGSRIQQMFMDKAGMLILSAISLVLILYPKEKSAEVTFLDVGQGDGIYISAGDGTTYFIDGGSSSVSQVGKYRILPFLKSKGVSSIDYWFVSHTDTDHMSGLLEVLVSGYSVNYLVFADAAPLDENMQILLNAATHNQTEILYMKSGDSIYSSCMDIHCLYPGNDEISDKNDASLVLEFEFKEETLRRKDFRAIFSGDISSEVEDFLLEQELLRDVDLYKAAHHGSKYSSCEAFLQTIQPEISVVSCSQNNLYGHPHADTIERLEKVGSEVYYTMRSGQVSILLDEHMAVQEWLKLNSPIC